MKLIIAGSRDLVLRPESLDLCFIHFKVVPVHKITEVVSGCALGMDRSGENWAAYHGVGSTSFPAEWKKYGRSAGPRRNQAMAEYADAAAIFINNNSRGSTNMQEHMVRLRKPFVSMIFEDEKPLNFYSWHNDKWDAFWHD